MVEILKPADGVAVTVAFLKAQFTSRSETASVRSKIPAPRPARFVRVRLMGATRSYVARYAPMLTFECWAPDDTSAWNLGALTEALITSMPDLSPDCTGVTEVGGLVYQPDPDTGTDRYVFTKQIYLRSAVLA